MQLEPAAGFSPASGESPGKGRNQPDSTGLESPRAGTTGVGERHGSAVIG